MFNEGFCWVDEAGRYKVDDYIGIETEADWVKVSSPTVPIDYALYDFEKQEWVMDMDRAIPFQWGIIRRERDSLLSQCDWTMIPDAPTDKEAWAVYRQALRDITEQEDPFNIVWPTSPFEEL